VRVTTAFNRLLALPGTTVRDVSFEPAQITVTVALRRRRLACADCSHSSRARYDTGTVDSSWRRLDLGRLRLVVKAKLRRIDCPTHGVRTEGVPFARVESGFTRDFEDLVAWLATRMDKTAVRRFLRVAWQTVGAICARVVADRLNPGRLEALFEVGIDEVSWRKGDRYLTLVTDHRCGKVVWGAEGKDTATCDQFFAELGADRAAKLTAVSTDMGAAYLKSVAKPGHAPTRPCASTRSTSSPSPATRSIRSADRSGTNCARWTPTRPRSSKAPGGCCSSVPSV
jgi:transposase